jgi:hypothetical protein
MNCDIGAAGMKLWQDIVLPKGKVKRPPRCRLGVSIGGHTIEISRRWQVPIYILLYMHQCVQINVFWHLIRVLHSLARRRRFITNFQDRSSYPLVPPTSYHWWFVKATGPPMPPPTLVFLAKFVAQTSTDQLARSTSCTNLLCEILGLVASMAKSVSRPRLADAPKLERALIYKLPYTHIKKSNWRERLRYV